MKLQYHLLPIPVSALLILLAQSGTAIDPSTVSMGGSVLTAGVLAWYIVYDVRVRTPAMLAAFTSEQASIRQSFTEEQQEIRRTFREEQASMRDSYRMVIDNIRTTFTTEQGSIRQAFINEQAACRQHFEKETAELRSMLIENLKGMRTAVHDVRETANTLLVGKTLKDTQGES